MFAAAITALFAMDMKESGQQGRVLRADADLYLGYELDGISCGYHHALPGDRDHLNPAVYPGWFYDPR